MGSATGKVIACSRARRRWSSKFGWRDQICSVLTHLPMERAFVRAFPAV